MNTTIQITPRAFGNIAAAAISHGCDITTYLVRTAAAKAGSSAAPAEPPSAPAPGRREILALVDAMCPEPPASMPTPNQPH